MWVFPSEGKSISFYRSKPKICFSAWPHLVVFSPFVAETNLLIFWVISNKWLRTKCFLSYAGVSGLETRKIWNFCCSNKTQKLNKEKKRKESIKSETDIWSLFLTWKQQLTKWSHQRVDSAARTELSVRSHDLYQQIEVQVFKFPSFFWAL